MWFSSVRLWPQGTRRAPPRGRPAGRRPRKLVPVLESLEERLAPAAFRVTSLADSNAAGSGSLRRAITDSNNTAGPANDIDILTPGTYFLTLNGRNDDNSAGDLDILSNSVNIVNRSGGTVVIDAGGLTSERVFDISPAGAAINVRITGVTIQRGDRTAAQAGDDTVGGGIRVTGTSTLLLTFDIVQRNTALDGGGIAAAGLVTILNSIITDNTSTDNRPGHGGGGIFVGGTGAVTIGDCEFIGNIAAGDGGGILNTDKARVLIARCTFFDQLAGGYGGALSLESTGNSNLTEVTLSGNRAMFGGGLANTGAAGTTLLNDTIAFNSASTNVGGVFSSATSLYFTNTIVAKNTADAGSDPDVDNNTLAAAMVDLGGNFIGDNIGAADSFPAGTPNSKGSFVGTAGTPLDPLLDRLADNGAAIALPDGLPMLTFQDEPNSGNNGVRDRATTFAEPTDGRGFPRLIGNIPDIGAFEFQDFDLAVSTSAPAGTVHAGLPATFVLTVHNLGPTIAYAVTVTGALPPGTTVVAASDSFTVEDSVVTFAVPQLLPGASTSFTLTVIPAAPGPFTAKAFVSTHDDPNRANNTAAASVTVLPRPFPATGFADVTAFVQLVRQGRRRRPQRRLVFLVTNVSGTPLEGPLGLVVAGLPRGVKLLNAAGLTAGRQKFVRVDVGGDNLFDPGESAAVQLVFSRPFRPCRLRVLAGAFA
jgi:uncharacterized repeat protein (TIGR01451 family)